MPKTSTHGVARPAAHCGRHIHTHQQQTNDNSLLGSNLSANSQLAEKWNETAGHAMSNMCCWDYCNQIRRIINFWGNKNPDYYTVGVRDIEDDDLTNTSLYYFGKFKKDIQCMGLNVDFC